MSEEEKNKYSVIEEVTLTYEKDLIAKLKGTADKDAFYKLVKLYDSKIYSLVYRFLGHREDALEITQDVFLQVYRKIHQYKGDAPFYFWLQRIAVNYCINKVKTYKRDVLKKAEDIDNNLLKYTAKMPVNILEENEKKEFVRELIGRISLPYRMALMLKDIEGVSYEDIGRILKCSQGTVKSRLSRGREELKNLLKRMNKEVREYGL